MLKKNISVVFFLLIILLLIAIVIWVFQRRIERIQKRMELGAVVETARERASLN